MKWFHIPVCKISMGQIVFLKFGIVILELYTNIFVKFHYHWIISSKDITLSSSLPQAKKKDFLAVTDFWKTPYKILKPPIWSVNPIDSWLLYIKVIKITRGIFLIKGGATMIYRLVYICWITWNFQYFVTWKRISRFEARSVNNTLVT